MKTLIFQIKGINCQACLRLIQKKIGKLHGIKDLTVQLDGTARINADRNISKSELNGALAGTDYQII